MSTALTERWELGHRTSDGVDVTLFWSQPSNRVTIAVPDSHSNEALEFEVDGSAASETASRSSPHRPPQPSSPADSCSGSAPHEPSRRSDTADRTKRLGAGPVHLAVVSDGEGGTPRQRQRNPTKHNEQGPAGRGPGARPRQVPRTAQLDAVKATMMLEKYYTREQPDDLQRRERRLGAGAIQQNESEWSHLIAMLELARRWQELIGEFTGEDAQPVPRSA